MRLEATSFARTGAKYESQRAISEPRLPAVMERLAVVTRCSHGQEIHGRECPSDYCYRLVSGMAKCYVVLPGGRRQILDLLRPGDFFAFPPWGDGLYCGVEAVFDDTVIASYPRQLLQSLAASDPAVGGGVLRMALTAAERLEKLLLIIGRTTAREKVGAFLLALTESSAIDHQERLVLPISRYDIAEYLALSVETVSRSLTELKRRRFIALTGPRRVSIIDRHGLEGRDSLGASLPASREPDRFDQDLATSGNARINAAIPRHADCRSDQY
jgi:CRP/FNR family transcriptional regulator, nitrogen fixation regulation protein